MSRPATQADLMALAFLVAMVFVALLVSVGNAASVGAARSTCLEHPSWHYVGPGVITPARCTPPDATP